MITKVCVVLVYPRLSSPQQSLSFPQHPLYQSQNARDIGLLKKSNVFRLIVEKTCIFDTNAGFKQSLNNKRPTVKVDLLLSVKLYALNIYFSSCSHYAKYKFFGFGAV